MEAHPVSNYDDIVLSDFIVTVTASLRNVTLGEVKFGLSQKAKTKGLD